MNNLDEEYEMFILYLEKVTKYKYNRTMLNWLIDRLVK